MNLHVCKYAISYTTLFSYCIIFLLFTASIDSKMLFLFTHGQQLQIPSQPERVQFITYADPNGNYTLLYPQSWKVDYKEPFVKFGFPITQFSLPDHTSIVTITIANTELDEKEFKDGFLTFYPLILEERFNNGLEIINKTLGNFTIDGYTTGSIIFRNYVDNSMGVIEGLFITSIFENNKTISIIYTSSEKNFDHNMDELEAMLKSIKIVKEEPR